MKNKKILPQTNDIEKDYFSKGKRCIESSEILFNLQQSSRKNGEIITYEYGLLLIHGVELLLKSFFLLSEKISFGRYDIDKLFKYGHDYKKLYNDCLEIDKKGFLNDEQLKSLINDLSKKFYFGTIEARYPEYSGGTVFSFNTFFILKEKLICPLGKII